MENEIEHLGNSTSGIFEIDAQHLISSQTIETPDFFSDCLQEVIHLQSRAISRLEKSPDNWSDPPLH